MDESRAVQILANVFSCNAEENEDGYAFAVSRRANGHTVSIAKTALAATINELNQKSTYLSLWLCDENSMEILVREESSSLNRAFRLGNLVVRDDDNGVTYEISSASDAYILFFLDAISRHSDARLFLRGYPSSLLERRLTDQESPLSVFELVRMMYLRIATVVRIRTDAKASPTRLSSLANAFLFQMAFNTDIALVPQRELDALSRSGRISRMRRSRPSEIDPPRRTYSEDLTHHYLMAISTDNPVVEYLSHYHVLEHFYEAVFQDDLITTIQGQITEPAFSYRRKKDIKALIKTIRRSLKIQNDTITFSEEQALRLTLASFVEVPDLVSDLDNYDSKIIDFYRDNKVEFSNACEVDLRSVDLDAIFKSLAKRIYSTRNALVHSKDGDKAKYTPFVDDHALAKELPLLRFVAERTILRNSTLIE
ncbi:MAG: hypothetical protein EA380_05785 [Phycisphaeraceae bacterium]|nr:MAG: hypothetical protein EA380_05785 [Phycisphaeraceae bacterium]